MGLQEVREEKAEVQEEYKKVRGLTPPNKSHFEQGLLWLDEIEFEKQSPDDKEQVAGRELQSLRFERQQRRRSSD